MNIKKVDEIVNTLIETGFNGLSDKDLIDIIGHCNKIVKDRIQTRKKFMGLQK